MERILLIEPNYKNKYPPIGLMKLSTYFKSKGDFVQFNKGLLPVKKVQKFDRVLITTLFTFDYSICVDTIKYFVSILGIERVYVGGIAASIMPENFRRDIPGVQLIVGQLVSSNILGYMDNVNVDVMRLDYDILYDIDYEYPAADAYFIYTSRGCPNKCAFCAVKILEPFFYDCVNIVEQVKRVDEDYGIKHDLLIMDNNILYSQYFFNTVNLLKKLGFSSENNSVKKNPVMPYYLKSLKVRLECGKDYSALLKRIKKLFIDVKRRISHKDANLVDHAKDLIKNNRDEAFINYLIDNTLQINDFFCRYNYHKIKRYVDFNQGLDARLFDAEKASLLGSLSLKPCRIAFDNIESKYKYLQAMEMAYKGGVTFFSNYMLYNYNDKPEDLWNRIYINIKFAKEHSGVKLFSFPMKYADIYSTDRLFVGKYWHIKYLRAMNVILNVTKGVVAKEEDFFFAAYGNSPEEFLQILTMPDEFVRYRSFFTKNGMISKWRNLYLSLSESEINLLMDILDRLTSDKTSFDKKYTNTLDLILPFYKLRKKDFKNM